MSSMYDDALMSAATYNSDDSKPAREQLEDKGWESKGTPDT